MTWREGSLFSGYNGIGLALELLGLKVKTEWFCDPDPGAGALLKHHYPGVANLGDITKVDWSAVPPIEIVTGGFPCQDISNAGKREGITGARSSLWKHYVRAIRVLRPRLIFVENVAVLRSRGLDVVLTDLAELGFDAEWITIPASAAGAPHERSRIFLVAADATRERLDWARELRAGRRSESPDRHQPAADPYSEPVRIEPGRCGGQGWTGTALAQPDHQAAADAQGERWPEGWPEHAGFLGRSGAADGGAPGVDWGVYDFYVRRWEQLKGVPVPHPTVVGQRGGQVLSPYLTEWMMGVPGWITSVPGLSRNQQIKLAGNGVVPEQAALAFEELLKRLYS